MKALAESIAKLCDDAVLVALRDRGNHELVKQLLELREVSIPKGCDVPVPEVVEEFRMECEQLVTLDRKLVLRLRAEIAQMTTERDGLIRAAKERDAKMHELERLISNLRSELALSLAENNELKERYLKNAESHLEWQEEVIRGLLPLALREPPKKEKPGTNWDIEADWVIKTLKGVLDNLVAMKGDQCNCGECSQCGVREVLIFVMEQSGREVES
jgi:uncharacterized protein YhaN